VNFSNWPDLSDRISLTNLGSAMTTLGSGPNQVKQTLPTCSSIYLVASSNILSIFSTCFSNVSDQESKILTALRKTKNETSRGGTLRYCIKKEEL
jgi:hypothetical protein